jgi:hypothetical protein
MMMDPGKNRFIVDHAVAPLKKRGKKSSKKLVGLPPPDASKEYLSFEQACERFGLLQMNDPHVSETIQSYVAKYKLKEKNWAGIVESLDYLKTLFEDDHTLLRRLFYTNCAKQLSGYTLKDKDGQIKSFKGTKLKKVSVKKTNKDRKEYLTSLKCVLDQIQERAPYLVPYQGDEDNPLSGYRQRELLWQLRALYRSEMEIEELKKEDGGRKARYAFDPHRRRYVRIGTAINEPLTVFLIYIWKCKESKSGAPLNDEDYQKITEVMAFWKFFPRDIEYDTTQQVILLKDRIKYYRNKTIVFVPSEWSQEYHPMVYTD